MIKGELSIMDVLKLSRHDYLNELQIILMHIDMENSSEAKKSILAITDEMRQYSNLETIGLPALAQWLTTFEWVHTYFHKTLICEAESSIQATKEEDIIRYLDALFKEVEAILNPISEYDVIFNIKAMKAFWSIDITIKGELPIEELPNQQNESILVEKTISHNLWTFTIRGQ